jgi:hypothetical protein
MCTKIVTSTILALAVAGGFATTAAAQNPPAPIVIDGTLGDIGTQVQDEHNNVKELGPKNASTTKIGVINNAQVPMLDLTNPNASVDLDKVWLGTAQDANQVAWVYFAWTRDSVNGSGFVSLELDKTASGCDYSSNATLLQCNPWANRANGDFLISWDQQGNSHDIYLRVFQNGSWVTPDPCADPTPLGCLLDSTQAQATYTPTFNGGELAVNLVASGITTAGACTTFANNIPGTVTGNSDTADYKDVVLKDLKIQTCGSIKVVKKTLPAGQTGSYPYTVQNGGAVMFNPADSDCTTSGSDTTKCQATLTFDGDFDSIDNVVAATTYTLVEGGLAPGYLTPSISCLVPGDATEYPGTGFPVVVGKETVCTITNTLQASPTGATVPGSETRLTDSIVISGVLRTTGDSFTVDFKLYGDANCTGAEVGNAAEKTANTGITVTFASTSATTSNSISTGSSILVPNGTYHWRVTFHGNTYNNTFTTSCLGENSVVNVGFSGSGS